jgi:hypothetical protein
MRSEVNSVADAGTSSQANPVADAGTWKRYNDGGKMWWHNDVSGLWFYEATGNQWLHEAAGGNQQAPPHTTLGGLCSKRGKKEAVTPDQGDLEASTEASDGASTLGTFTGAASSHGPGGPVIPGPPGKPYDGKCTHRRYAENLYADGQLPAIGED